MDNSSDDDIITLRELKDKFAGKSVTTVRPDYSRDHTHFFDDDELFYYNNDDDDEAQYYLYWKHEKKVRRQIESDDPGLASLDIGFETFCGWPEEFGGIYTPRDWGESGKLIGRMTNLRELSFCNTGFELAFFSSPEKDIMEKFFEGLACNRSIKKMSFDCCDTYDGELYTLIVPFLANNHNVESLHAWIENPGDVAYLAQALSKFDSLKELSITSLDFYFGVGEIVSALSCHTHFQSLRIHPGGMGHDGCTEVAGLLQDPRTKLAKLDLSYLSFGESDATLLAEGLAGNTPLSDLYFDTLKVSESGWDAIFTALENSPSKLNSFSLQPVTNKFPPQLAKALSKLKHLKKLDLGTTDVLAKNINLQEWKAIFAGLQTSKCKLGDLTLSQITLKDDEATNFYDDGTDYLVNILLGNSLKRLCLSSDNNISTPAWHALFFAISSNHNSALECLNLSKCGFIDETLTALANALANNNTIRDLTLRYNQRVTAAGWQAFSTLALSGNNRFALETLDLCENWIGNDTMICFANSLAGNKRLKELFTDQGNFDYRLWAAYARVLCNTTSIMATFNSNHTLQKLYEFELYERKFRMPRSIRLLLQYNTEKTQSQVARLKIIKVHFRDGFAMPPFTDMDLNVLPHALSWMSRDSGSQVDGCFYGFLRSIFGMPLLIDVNGKSKNDITRSASGNNDILEQSSLYTPKNPVASSNTDSNYEKKPASGVPKVAATGASESKRKTDVSDDESRVDDEDENSKKRKRHPFDRCGYNEK